MKFNYIQIKHYKNLRKEIKKMKRMAVHNGIFHADDVFGVALMQSIYNDLEIIRTRDEELLNSFDARKDLPKTWGGLNKDDLSKLTWIENCTFCHPALFICGNKTKEGAISMAKVAVENKIDYSCRRANL